MKEKIKNISIYDRIDLWFSFAISIELNKYNNDNVLLCLIFQMKEIYNKSIHYGLSHNEFNNGENIYFLMLERVSFLDKNKK